MLIKQLWKPDYSFYVNVASSYSSDEMERLAKSGEGIRLVRGIELYRYERGDFIIPYRNVYMVLGALNEFERLEPMEKMEGSKQTVEICLGATAGDRVLDKSPEFAEQLSNLLTYLSRPQHWTGGKSREVKVVLPFKSHTKRDLLREFLDMYGERGIPREVLLDYAWRESFSCYTPDKVTGEPCGKCKPCFRKTVAFTLEGMVNREYAKRAREYILESGIWDQIQQGVYGRADEEKDIREFMEVTKSW